MQWGVGRVGVARQSSLNIIPERLFPDSPCRPAPPLGYARTVQAKVTSHGVGGAWLQWTLETEFALGCPDAFWL